MPKNQSMPSFKSKIKNYFRQDLTLQSKPITRNCFENPPIDFYISKVIEQQKNTYGYCSSKKKKDALFDNQLQICEYLEQTSWKDVPKTLRP